MGPAEPLQGSRNQPSRTPECFIFLDSCCFCAPQLLILPGALRAPDGGPGQGGGSLLDAHNEAPPSTARVLWGNMVFANSKSLQSKWNCFRKLLGAQNPDFPISKTRCLKEILARPAPKSRNCNPEWRRTLRLTVRMMKVYDSVAQGGFPL